MTTKTKTSNAQLDSLRWTKVDSCGYRTTQSLALPDSSSTITYATGPRYANNRLVWKPCTHSWNGSRIYDTFTVNHYPAYGSWPTVNWWQSAPSATESPPSSLPMLPIPSVQSAYDAWTNQLDLNVENSAMLYSGLIQLVPLLGMTLKCSAVFNRIGKELTRRMRRKPFTEVIKWAIQADLIDRFVIQPTIKDAHIVANATNYVLNTLSKAHQRNESITPFKATVSNLQTGESVKYTDPNWMTVKQVIVNCERHIVQQTTRTLFVLAEVKYDIDAVSPIQLWANRVGLTKPLEAIWDLIPYSFVLDYFARTGEFIEHVSNQWSSIEGLVGKVSRIHDAWQTIKSIRVMRHECILGPWNYWTYQPGLVSTKTGRGLTDIGSGLFVRERVSLGDLHRSGFWDNNGLFETNLSSTRKRTIAELVLQRAL